MSPTSLNLNLVQNLFRDGVEQWSLMQNQVQSCDDVEQWNLMPNLSRDDVKQHQSGSNQYQIPKDGR